MSVDGNGTQGNLIKMQSGMEKGGSGGVVEKHSLASMKETEAKTDNSLNSKKMELLPCINVQTVD